MTNVRRSHRRVLSLTGAAIAPIVLAMVVGLPRSTAASPQTGACSTPDPFATLGGGTCVNGGWIPPGMTPPGTPAPPSTPPPSTPPPSSSSCTTPDPFASLGGGTCANGGWLPPGMSPPSTPPAPPNPPAPPPPPRPPLEPDPADGPINDGSCVPPDPFATIGGGSCWRGGWLPPGMTPPGALFAINGVAFETTPSGPTAVPHATIAAMDQSLMTDALGLFQVLWPFEFAPYGTFAASAAGFDLSVLSTDHASTPAIEMRRVQPGDGCCRVRGRVLSHSFLTGDAPIAGASVQLVFEDINGVPTQIFETTTTAADGSYAFSTPLDGTSLYEVQVFTNDDRFGEAGFIATPTGNVFVVVELRAFAK